MRYRLRTQFQDEWANIVEKIDDRFGLSLKYGVGDPAIGQRLQRASESFSQVETFQKVFEVRLAATDQALGKMMLGTYLLGYEQAMEEAYPAAQRRTDEDAFEAERRRANLANPQPAHWGKGYRRASEVLKDDFVFSEAYRAAWDKAEERARPFLRFVLWSTVEVPLGSELLLGTDAGGTAERVVVLHKSPTEASKATVVLPTFDDPRGGHVYEITQPGTADHYLLFPETFGDMVSDADVDLSNLEELLK